MRFAIRTYSASYDDTPVRARECYPKRGAIVSAPVQSPSQSKDKLGLMADYLSPKHVLIVPVA